MEVCKYTKTNKKKKYKNNKQKKGLGCSCLTPERCDSDQACKYKEGEECSSDCFGCGWKGTPGGPATPGTCGPKNHYHYRLKYTHNKAGQKTSIRHTKLCFNPPGKEKIFCRYTNAVPYWVQKEGQCLDHGSTSSILETITLGTCSSLVLLARFFILFRLFFFMVIEVFTMLRLSLRF